MIIGVLQALQALVAPDDVVELRQGYSELLAWRDGDGACVDLVQIFRSMS